MTSEKLGEKIIFEADRLKEYWAITKAPVLHGEIRMGCLKASEIKLFTYAMKALAEYKVAVSRIEEVSVGFSEMQLFLLSSVADVHKRTFLKANDLLWKSVFTRFTPKLFRRFELRNNFTIVSVPDFKVLTLN